MLALREAKRDQAEVIRKKCLEITKLADLQHFTTNISHGQEMKYDTSAKDKLLP